MQNTKVILLLVSLLLCTFMFSCSSGKLTEDKARKAVDALLAQGERLPDNSPRPATLLEWQGLVQISETEMHGKARIQHKDGIMTGKFIFHKTSDGKWVLDKVQFRSKSGFAWWIQDVFQKVE